jgi:hypothetical protein
MEGMAKSRGGTPAHPEANPVSLPEPIEVRLERSEFMYFNWTLALERPVFTFLMYTFILLTLAGMVGVWPAAGLYALAALVPLLGYTLLVWLTAKRLWHHVPGIRQPRRYLFKENTYLVEEEGAINPVAYGTLERVLESRNGFYLMRRDGRADLLPKRVLKDEVYFRRFLQAKVNEVGGSSLL